MAGCWLKRRENGLSEATHRGYHEIIIDEKTLARKIT